MNRETFRKEKIERHDSIGPCTSALNKFFLRSKGASFFDYTFFHVDYYYIKYSQQIWRDQLWLPVETPNLRRFGDEDMELASVSLYRFQAVSDQEKLSTRNPISFFRSLDSYWQSSERDFNTIMALFLLAVSDRGFLFDSAIQGSVPSLFITRAFIEKLKVSDDILHSSILQNHPQFAAPLGSRFDHMQEQVRNFHLMLPSRITFCDRWDNFTMPTIRKMQHMNKCYRNDFDIEFLLDDASRNQLETAVMDCYIWYMSTRRHLGIDNAADLDRSVSYLQRKRDSSDSNEFRENIAKIVDEISGTETIYAFPFLAYRVITKFYATIGNGEFPNVEKILNDTPSSPNLEIKSNETSSKQWNRWNLLLFKQLCYRIGPLLPEDAVERSMYIFEFSEDITMECYPDDELLELHPTDDRIKEYIVRGENAGIAALPELKEIVDYTARNLEISPFDVLNYRPWNETPQSLLDFMESSKGGRGAGRGRKQTKRKMLSELITNMADYPDIKQSYYRLVFEDESGYGSGIPTYKWAYQLGYLIDRIINEPTIQNALEAELASSPELVELGIHQFFLSEFAQEVKALVTVLAKRILYGNDVLNLKIQPI